jgi:gamma-glutamyl-gamma-aminobutyraldehyde dehydrogenase
MSNLLTHEEYQAIEKSIDYPTNAFVNGQFQSAKSGDTFATINPATGQLIAHIAACNADDVDHAVTKAREAFDQGHWSKLHPSERKEALIKLAKLIKKNTHELAVLESIDSGKPIRDCATVDLPETIQTIIWHAEAIDKIYDQSAPTGEDALAVIVREAVGVVGCILPWNFPLMMLAWKIAPALAAGNSVIVKPAEQTSLTTLKIAELAIDAGIPRGVLNVVTGLGPDVGEPLGLHDDVDMVSFTGSTETGRRFLRYSADSNLKKIVLECGGKNPAIVLDDAEELDLVAEHLVNAAFWNMGQNCSAASRLIVQENIKKELLDKMLAHLRDWKTGDPLNPSNYLGSLIDKEHFEKVCAYLDNNNIIVGGTTEQPCYVMPTIVDQVEQNSKLAQEEIFGPILSVITVNSFDEAIAAANNTDYGLTASIFTANGKKAIRAARAIKAGTITINCYGEGDMSTPFGGYKQSGFGGRDNSIHAHDQYTEIKTIWIDLSDRAPEESLD